MTGSFVPLVNTLFAVLLIAEKPLYIVMYLL